MKNLAIITSHPIQYYAPWFKHLAAQIQINLKVFYLWDFGVSTRNDEEFQQSLQWDVPLLEGYDYAFVPNHSNAPSVHHFWGLNNPALTDLVKQFQPDAVLLMCYNYATIYKFLWQWRYEKIPLLFRGDSHRLVSLKGFKSWVKKVWIQQIYSQIDACLYVGQANYQYFRHHNIQADRLFYTPHAIDNARFFKAKSEANYASQIWKKELGIPENYRVILFAGKFVSKKRPQDLLQAFAKAHLENTALVFVGAGELESILRQQASEIEQVYFAPFQNQSLMPRTYALADVLVLPSFGPGETWGLSVNEAMAMGKAVIVSSHVGCATDLVQLQESTSEQNGLVFPAGDCDALSRALERAFSQPEQLRRWGEAGQRRIRKFSYERMTQGLLRALAALSSHSDQQPLIQGDVTLG